MKFSVEVVSADSTQIHKETVDSSDDVCDNGWFNLLGVTSRVESQVLYALLNRV